MSEIISVSAVAAEVKARIKLKLPSTIRLYKRDEDPDRSRLTCTFPNRTGHITVLVQRYITGVVEAAIDISEVNFACECNQTVLGNTEQELVNNIAYRIEALWTVADRTYQLHEKMLKKLYAELAELAELAEAHPTIKVGQNPNHERVIDVDLGGRDLLYRVWLHDSNRATVGRRNGPEPEDMLVNEVVAWFRREQEKLNKREEEDSVKMDQLRKARGEAATLSKQFRGKGLDFYAGDNGRVEVRLSVEVTKEQAEGLANVILDFFKQNK